MLNEECRCYICRKRNTIVIKGVTNQLQETFERSIGDEGAMLKGYEEYDGSPMDTTKSYEVTESSIQGKSNLFNQIF